MAVSGHKLDLERNVLLRSRFQGKLWELEGLEVAISVCRDNFSQVRRKDTILFENFHAKDSGIEQVLPRLHT